MVENNSVVGNGSSMRKINERVILVQVLVSLFLCINSLLIITFFMKDFFYRNMRYILFVTTLLSDCLTLIVTNIMLILAYFSIPLQMWLCLIIVTLLSVYNFVTPLTLTAMTLERYVAICMPLRHVELCSTRSSLGCILLIHCLSSVPCFIILSIFCSSITLIFFKQYNICSVEMFIIKTWQGHLRSAISQFYFLIMLITIVFCYVEIIKVAKTASGENKKSVWRGLKTVILHAFQLLLCLSYMWCPLTEAAALKINFMFFVNIRLFNYIMFSLVPRCLSPLIYGLRDDKFFLALKYYALCGCVRNKSLNLHK